MMRYMRITLYFLVGFAGCLIASINLDNFVGHNQEYEFAVWKIPVGLIAYSWAIWMIIKEAHDAK